MSGYHLAELNLAWMRAPLEDPVMAGFSDNLDRVNAIADRSPGFVWRWITPEGDDSEERIFGPLMLANVSLWRSLEDLRAFVFAQDHGSFVRNRNQWFHRQDDAYFVLWWVPAGHVPTLEEAQQKLLLLRATGASAAAFNWREPFPAPAE